MGNIYLVRHAVTDYNLENRFQGQLDIPLNKKGKAQAERLKYYFKGKKIDLIYTSDLKRATETAEYLSKDLNQSLRILSNLREVNVGRLEGMKWEEVKKTYPAWVSKGHNYGYPGGETRIDIEKRVVNLWDYICQCHSTDNIILVSHGGIIKTLICQLLGIEASNRKKLIIDNCSVSWIVLSESGCRVKALNTVLHLQ